MKKPNRYQTIVQYYHSANAKAAKLKATRPIPTKDLAAEFGSEVLVELPVAPEDVAVAVPVAVPVVLLELLDEVELVPSPMARVALATIGFTEVP